MSSVISGDNHMDVAHNEGRLPYYCAPMMVSHFAALLELGEQLELLIIRHWDWIVGHFLFCQLRVRGSVQWESIYLTAGLVPSMLICQRVYASGGKVSLQNNRSLLDPSTVAYPALYRRDIPRVWDWLQGDVPGCEI